MSPEDPEENTNLAALACHYSERLDDVGTALTRDGAFGLILIDGARLEQIERNYGVQAHRRALESFRLLVREACDPDLEEADILVDLLLQVHADAAAALVVADRGDVSRCSRHCRELDRIVKAPHPAARQEAGDGDFAGLP